MSAFVVDYKPGDSDFARPWGGYITVRTGHLPEDQGALAFCDKVIKVNPGAKLSKQKHVGRQEDWTVAAGEATVHIGQRPDRMKTVVVKPDESIHIPHGHWHYVENKGPTTLVFTERQSGIYLHEQDNIRLPTPEDPRTTNVPAMKEIRKDIKARQLSWPKLVA